MANGRSFLASAVGWVIAAIVVIVLFGVVIATIKFIVKAAVFLFVVGALLVVYFRLRDTD